LGSIIFRTNTIGYLSQRERVFNHLTVSEHLQLQQVYSKHPQFLSLPIYARLFSVIESKQKYFASTLSGGEQLILNLLCLLILNPNTIILDEPSDSLDLINKEFLFDIIQLWKNESKSIIIIEQDVTFLNKIADNIINLTKTL
jgi:ABC-type branched-subunit amino acid transport system ATPase component